MIVFGLIENGKLLKEFTSYEEAVAKISNIIHFDEKFDLYRDNNWLRHGWVEKTHAVIELLDPTLKKIIKVHHYEIVEYDIF